MPNRHPRFPPFLSFFQLKMMINDGDDDDFSSFFMINDDDSDDECHF